MKFKIPFDMIATSCWRDSLHGGFMTVRQGKEMNQIHPVMLEQQQ